MELFTLGIGNYTETDVEQAARALSGWQVNGFNAVCASARFDGSAKTFLGQTGNFGYAGIVDIIFTKGAASLFICRKLYREFIYYRPNEAFVGQMARVFRDNHFELKPLLAFLFRSEAFYADAVKGSQIKPPVQVLIGSLKLLNVRNMATADWTYVSDTGRNLQQKLFEPPGVEGWKGQREWISSNTYPQRGGYTDAMISGRFMPRYCVITSASVPMQPGRYWPTLLFRPCPSSNARPEPLILP